MDINPALYKRKNKTGGYTYYVKFVDQATGKTVKTVSTRTSSRNAAIAWLMGEGSDLFSKPAKDQTFEEYTKNLFIWDECPYIEKQGSFRNVK